MKITDDEVAAAIASYNRLYMTVQGQMKAAIKAAYRVRKERKKQKREAKSSILDDDQQEAIKAALDPDEVAAVQTAYDQFVAAQYIPKPLTFEPGKSYRTRDGRKAIVGLSDGYFVVGKIEGVTRHWNPDGTYQDEVANSLDLIAPWED